MIAERRPAAGSEPGALAREARERLLAASDSDYRSNLQRLLAADVKVIGVRVPEIRRLARSMRSDHPDLTVESAAQLLDALCAERVRDEILLGIFTLSQYRRQFSPALWDHVERCVDALDNWETCDQLAINVVGEMVAREMSLLACLLDWTRSANRWRRRCAVAATTVLNQKGRTRHAESLRVCDQLMTDEDPDVRKAVAWAIREVAKASEAEAFAFLQRWKRTAHPRVIREGSQKLTPEHRAAVLGSR